MASRRIAGITIEIDGNTTKLQNALKSVDKQLSTTQANLRDINKLLKMDPGNAELLTQKQKNLAGAVKDTKTRLDELKKAQSGIKEGTPEWDALQREIIDTEQKLKSATKELKSFGTVGSQQVKAVGDKMKEIGGNVTSAGQELTKLSAPLIAAGTVGVVKFAEVDKTMQLTNKTMGNTAEEAELLNKAMKEAAANSTFGMSDAATATLNFARAGLNASEAAETLAPAMNLAAGSGGDLDTVSAGLVATLNGFNAPFKDAADYADIFATACNNSALDIDSLCNSMSVAAPVFSTAGYSVRDAATYLGVMANKGIDANKAANSLKTGIARLAAPTGPAADALDALGFSITDANGNMKSSIQIQKELHDKFKNLSEAEQIAAASAIFGKNQMAPWLALINTAPEEVQALDSSLSSCAGTTKEMADAMMSGFGGSLEKIKSSIDVAATSLGEALAPTIQKVADKIQAAVDWFNGLDKSQQQLIAKIGLVVAAAGPALIVLGHVLTGVGSIIKVVGSLMGVMSGLGSAFGVVKGAISGLSAVITSGGGIIASLGSLASAAAPFLIGGAIVAGVIAGVVLIVKNWDKIKETAKAVGKAFKEAGKKIVDTAKEIGAKAAKAFETLKAKAAAAFEKLKTTASNIWGNIKTKISTVASGAKDAATSAFNTLKTNVSNAWSTLKSATSTAWQNIKSTASSQFKDLKSALSSTAKTIKSNLSDTWSAVRTKAGDAWKAIKTKASDAWGGIKDTIMNKAKGIVDKVLPKWQSLTEKINKHTETMREKVEKGFGSLQTNLGNAVSGIYNTLSGPFSRAKETIVGVASVIRSAFSNFHISIPRFKLPHISVAWKTISSKLGIKIPKISVSWYKKAYDNPMMFTKPTVLQTPQGYKGFGDGNGGEVVLGMNKLKQLVGASGDMNTTINIYATPGMDINQLADKVQNRLVAVQKQRELAYA